ncbi:MAG: alanine racemase [Nocardioidaceae bacterium]
MELPEMVSRAEIVVDQDAITRNVATLRARVRQRSEGTAMMAVVKADGYGHGMVEAARAARAGGADWLGAAVLEEALALRGAGDTGPILTWLAVPGEDYAPAVDAGIDLTASSVAQAEAVAAAARSVGRRARVQLKVDTGLNRNGASWADWKGLVEHAADLEQTGAVQVTGIWSHFACSDEPGHPANDEQEHVFVQALKVVDAVGVAPEVRHLSNSAGTLLRPWSDYDLVRCGIACYGVSPAPDVAGAAELGLVPAMTARARLAMVKRLAAGAGVSYGHSWVAPRATRVGLVPVGYGDGVPRHASSSAEVLVGGVRRPVVGRVCMDQLVVDLGDTPAEPGDPVVLFGTGADGAPTAQDWAQACGTIAYEIVTRVGGRFTRRQLSRTGPNGPVEPAGEAGRDLRAEGSVDA